MRNLKSMSTEDLQAAWNLLWAQKDLEYTDDQKAEFRALSYELCERIKR